MDTKRAVGLGALGLQSQSWRLRGSGSRSTTAAPSAPMSANPRARRQQEAGPRPGSELWEFHATPQQANIMEILGTNPATYLNIGWQIFLIVRNKQEKKKRTKFSQFHFSCCLPCYLAPSRTPPKFFLQSFPFSMGPCLQTEKFSSLEYKQLDVVKGAVIFTTLSDSRPASWTESRKCQALVSQRQL